LAAELVLSAGELLDRALDVAEVPSGLRSPLTGVSCLVVAGLEDLLAVCELGEPAGDGVELGGECAALGVDRT
jgi:hypothetical protein